MGFYLNKASKMKLNLRLLSAVPTKVNYAPLAKGPLPPPPLMRNIALNSFKAQSAPYLVMLCGVWAVSFWYFHERPKMKEYGVFHSVKASWQEEGAEDAEASGESTGEEE